MFPGFVQGGTLLGSAALTLGSKVCSNSERGLLGVAVDPAFASNRFVYLFYRRAPSSASHASRCLTRT